MDKVNINSFMLRIFAATLFAIALVATPAVAQKKYDPGATDTEIKIGNITSLHGFILGIRGGSPRRGCVLSDDQRPRRNKRPQDQLRKSSTMALIPANLVELAHKLVEQDGVLLIFSSFGSREQRWRSAST